MKAFRRIFNFFDAASFSVKKKIALKDECRLIPVKCNFDIAQDVIPWLYISITSVVFFFKRPKPFGRGTTSYWLDDIRCTGDEKSIKQCSHREWGQHNCLAINPASVKCELNAHDKTITPEPIKSAAGRVNY